MSALELAPVVKTIELARSATDAFRLFTADMGKWWPLETHALSPENETKVERLVVEPWVGGRVYELAEDGREFLWGEVLAYVPGSHFAMQWRLGRPIEQGTEVAVDFEPLAERRCRVTLTHSHWERLGDEGPANRAGYNQGWVQVFEQRFADYVRAG